MKQADAMLRDTFKRGGAEQHIAQLLSADYVRPGNAGHAFAWFDKHLGKRKEQ
jgi:hypothetical protein